MYSHRQVSGYQEYKFERVLQKKQKKTAQHGSPGRHFEIILQQKTQPNTIKKHSNL